MLNTKTLTLSNFNYNLPQALIAQKPIRPRDHSRLLVLDRNFAQSDKTTGAEARGLKLEHKHFYDLQKYLRKGDVLVFNNSKVIPARLHGAKDTGGKIEVFLLKKITAGPRTRSYPDSGKVWECMFKGKVKKDLEIKFKNNFKGKVLDKNRIIFNKKNILSIGETPIPPYINKKSNLKEYQTVYAEHEGSVAAPTAGFHFTKKMLAQLKKKGVGVEFITLHVGLGTFTPVREENITKHQMHPEYISVSKKTVENIKKAKRVIAVGTTTVRTLEATKLKAYQGWVNIFIYPGYKFKVVDAMITNFHLPKSSLIMLVSAFAGTNKIKKAYQEAVKQKYRFYSFGDAMLIM